MPTIPSDDFHSSGATAPRQPRSWAALFALLLALYIALWGLLGWRDLSDRTRAGFSSDGQGIVVAVEPGSPAERAGLKPGDRIVAVNGASFLESGGLGALRAQAPGESRLLDVERGTGIFQANVEYAPLAHHALAVEHGRIIVGLLFLLFPVMALQRRNWPPTRILLFAGAGLGLALLEGPLFQQPGLRSVFLALNGALVAAAFAAALHFHLAFPLVGRPVARWPRSVLLYLPAALAAVVLGVRLSQPPGPAPVLDFAMQAVSVVVFVGYLLVSLFVLLRNYSRTDRELRQAHGVNWLLWGTVLGLLPALLAELLAAFSPDSVLPGQDFYFVSLALVPACWAWAASRGISRAQVNR